HQREAGKAFYAKTRTLASTGNPRQLKAGRSRGSCLYAAGKRRVFNLSRRSLVVNSARARGARDESAYNTGHAWWFSELTSGALRTRSTACRTGCEFGSNA